MMIVSGYDVGPQLHDGPSSQIYRANRAADGLPVILKLLKPASPSPERLAWFKQEYERLRGLDLPGVVRVHALQSEQDRWVMVLEDFHGESLDRLIARRDRDVRRLLAVSIATAEALGQVHQHDVIHKDINPSNIVWNAAAGELKLIDFGISTVLPRESPPLRSPEVLQGTLAYLSPEQTGRMNRTIDYRTDFYSLGVTLYELFTGELPFRCDDAMELVHCHLARQPVPPHERDRAVPKAVSDVIMKLLGKTAESRYQSTYGIKADLLECLAALDQRNIDGADGVGAGPAPFVPGRHDVPDRFQIPQKLYGREREIEALVAAFERVAGPGDAGHGQPELVLLAGPSGIGKSRIIQELYGPITRRRGYVAAGRFEQLPSGAPYSAVASALRSLLRQLLCEGEAQRARLREALEGALGPNAQVIIEFVPEVELLLGSQPPAQPLGPTEAQNRFDGTFLRFVGVLARPSHPLVLFLDDLQRADAGSLRLLDLLLSGDEVQHLLVLGAYRDNEVGPAHPLKLALDALIRAGAALHPIRVGPLRLQPIAELVADTTAGDAASAQPLAELLARKTDGNPLFVSELLKELEHEGLLCFDREKRRWAFDVAQIKAKAFPDNVVDLILGSLRRLPEPTQRSLRLAACLGGSFDLHTLWIVEPLGPHDQRAPRVPLEDAHARPPAATFARLLPALQEGFLLGTSEPTVVASQAAGSPLLAGDFRFLHDRVQQAAYALMGEDERKAVHLWIARRLTASAPEPERGEEVFVLADQFNRAGNLVVDDAERAGVAALNLAAGRRARAAMAYAAARDYLAAGARALGDRGGDDGDGDGDAWTRSPGLALDLYRELADAEHLNGDHERAGALAKRCLSRAGSALEKAGVSTMLVAHATRLGRHADAIGAARHGLSLLGVDLPEGGVEAEVAADAAFAAAQAKVAGREVASLLDRPAMTDPWARTATRLLLEVLSSAFSVSPALYRLVVFKAVDLALEHGHPPESCDLYAHHGHLLSGVHGEHRTGFDFGTLSLRLSERSSRLDDKCRSSFLLGNFVLPWVEPLRAALPLNDAGFQCGLASGELQFAGYILIYKLMNRFYEGRPMAQVLSELPGSLAFNQKTRNQIATDCILGLELALSNLSGVTRSKGEFSTEELSEAEYLAACGSHQSQMAVCYYQIFKTQALTLHGDPAAALVASATAARLLPSIMGNVAVAEHGFYTALSLAALCPAEPGEARFRALEQLEEAVVQLKRAAGSCPANFAHMHALVAAEAARVAGRVEALDLYDASIEAARANGFAQDEALANELAAKFWLERGKEKVAGAYIAEAYYGYQLWGARRKVAELESRHPWLLLQDTTASLRAPTLHGSTAPTTTGQRASSSLDLSGVLKASQAISGEIVLEKLLTKLMEIVIENAGAQRGVLILEARGELVVHVEALSSSSSSSPAVSTALTPVPVSRYAAIAEGVVRYVGRTRESVILSDASCEGAFTGDAYVAASRPRSVLCTPLVHQGQLLGMLYIENNLTTGAFTPERLEVLRLLSSQIAISIQNARLYNEMEQKVEERTDELKRRNGDLQAAVLHLKTTQAQLIQSEKMASLGQLTAGIAHEIKNPLNFVNNFAELNAELAGELAVAMEARPDARLGDAEVKETLVYLKLNSDKIRAHGERADSIVRSMMQHASGAEGERQKADVNALVEEYVNLAYHGIRAQQRDLQVTIERDYDPEVGAVELLPQEMGRVLVNLFNNAFYAVRDRQLKADGPYAPCVAVSTRRHGDHVRILVRDNGFGIPVAVRNKIFVPFFTTKPPGSGTGLGLSMSYDIVVHGHRGMLAVEGAEGEGATFIVTLPG